MIHHRVEQGSAEWHKLHIGIPTASQFHRIITPAKWEFSKQARRYALELALQVLTNEPPRDLTGLWAIERGKELEVAAARAYAFEEDMEAEIELCGFLTTDDGKIGATPDRLINKAKHRPAGLEIKCPLPYQHFEYIIDGFGPDYLPQAQGQILVGEFDFVDRYSYHPAMPPRLDRTWRDDGKQKLLQMALGNFLEMRDEILEKARRLGVFSQ